MADNVIVTLLNVAKEVLDNLLPAVAEDLFGLDVDFYYPISNPSIYGSRGNNYEYAVTPDLSGKYLTFGVFSERFQGDKTHDMYNGQEVYILVSGDTVIPRNSKVIVKLTTDKVFTYRVHTINIFPGDNESIFSKLMLVPMEVKV